MSRRYHSSTAVKTTLTTGVNSTDTTLSVGSVSGFPATTPYTLGVDRGTAAEELVTVTAVVGTTLTVTRGVDGTSGQAHAAAAAVEHVVSARDLQEPNAHMFGTAQAHTDLTVTPSVASAKGLVVRAVASQTGNLVELQNSSGTATVALNAGGVPFRGGSWVFNHEAEENAKFEAASATKKGLVVRAAASQTANLAEFQNSSGAVLHAVRADGTLALIPATVGTATAGTGQPTPANVASFYGITLTDGQQFRIPLYNV